MLTAKKYLNAVLDFCLWLAFTLYLSGGFTLFGKSAFAYPRDFFHVIIVFALIAVAINANLSELSFTKAFGELNQWLTDRKSKPRTLGGWVAAFGAVLLLIFFILTPLVRHWSYGTWRWDLGALQQIIWRGGHGLELSSTIILNSPAPLHFLRQQHLELWLLLTALVYKVAPFAETLLVLQSFALISCMIPLWKIARQLLPASVAPIMILIMFWFSENLHRANVWDVHENAFISVFALWAFYFFLRRRWLAAAVFTLVVASFKEDAWVIAGGLGCYFFFSEKKYFFGTVSAVAGFTVFAAYGAMFTVQSVALSARYGYLGNNMHEAAAIIKARPWVFIEQLVSFMNLKFLKDLFFMGAGTWVFSGWALITVAPVFFEIALSTYEPARNLNDHYVTPLIGPIFYCVCLGLRKISANGIIGPHVSKVAVVALILSAWPLEYSEPANIKYMMTTAGFKNHACYAEFLSHLPADAPVYANDPFTTRIANRAVVLKYAKATPIALTGSYVIFEDTQPVPENTQLVTKACGYKLARRTD